MAYQIYTTDAIVCGGKAMNIADRSHLLFTREAGMLFATARSVREERSRQRYALQDLSCVRVSLVKGKAGWRVGSVQGLGNYYFAATDRAARGSVISFARLLRRFVHGEVGDVHLYDTVTQSFRLLAGPLQSRSVVDRICSLRVLSHLGYVDAGKLPDFVMGGDSTTIDQPLEQSVLVLLDKHYQRAFSQSHL